MSNTLEDRLQEHSNAFDGLLSLIPAKYYYDEDTSNQWQQKRKTKEEHQANKRHKLNPESNKNKNAKDISKDNEKTAKPVILPGEKFKQHMALRAAAAEAEAAEETEETEDAEEESVAEYNDSELSDDSDDVKEDADEDAELLQNNVTIVFDDNGEEVGGEEEYKKAEVQAAKKNGKKELTKEEQEAKEKKHLELKAKLQAKIQSMREKRKAPGTKIAGAATSRQQILEERRRKAELKKEQRKNQVLGAEVDEESSSEEEQDEENANPAANVMFGNIEFLDGERASSDLKSTRRIGKKKGPSNNDIKGHLKIIEREKTRKGELTPEAKEKLEDKNKWQKALASVQGVKVKDDEKLLKKALRRKESKKRKSGREWSERIQTVHDEKKMKADRRDENLRIRKENKGKSRKDQVKQLPSYKRNRNSKKMAGSKVGVKKDGKDGKNGKGGDGDGRAGRGGKGKRAGFEGGIKSHKKK